VVIEVADWACVVENKIGSGEHSNQLERYEQNLRRLLPGKERFGVFLTVGGAEPNESAGGFFRGWSHVDLACILRKITAQKSEWLSPKQRLLLEDYDLNLQLHVMNEGPLIDAARKLWKEHAAALDFILQHRPDPSRQVLQALKEEVTNRGWMLGSTEGRFVRFLTPALHAVIPRNGDGRGWTGGEAFLFEFLVQPHSLANPHTHRLKFRTVLSPCGPENRPTRDRLFALLNGIPGATVDPPGDWPRHFEISTEVSLPSTQDPSSNFDSLLPFWSDVADLVQKVENQLLAARLNA
jgi:hypothetical protein